MKKKMIINRLASLTLAAVLAATMYVPTAAYATEVTNETPVETTTEQAAPVTEQPATAAAPAAQEAPAAEAPAAADQVATEQPAAENNESAEVTDESQYGEATGRKGYGNEAGTTTWAEYTKDGDTILVFSSTGVSDLDEDNAVTQILDENGKSVKNELKNKVTKVVFETGITGIGWTALYSNSGYEPTYNKTNYTVDQTKTDLFKDFTKLTTVIPCETIKRIGWSAFRKCSNLSEFDFTKCPQLEEIMNQAFNECKSLNTVDLSNCNALETIAWSAFKGSGKGNEACLSLPSSGVLSIIGGYAFYQYASNNAAGTEVDFSGVAGSVTQVLQKAFEGSNVIGEMTGFKNLEKLSNDALRNSHINYVPYDPSQDEEEIIEEQNVENNEQEVIVEEQKVENNEQEVIVEEQKVENNEQEVIVEEQKVENNEQEVIVEEQKVENNDQVVIVEEQNVENIEQVVESDDQDEIIELPAALGTIVSVVESVVAPANSDVAPANSDVALASSEADVTGIAAGKSAGKAAGSSAALTSFEDSAAPAAAPVADNVSISEADVPMADAQSDSSLGIILGGMAASLLMAMAAVMVIVRRKSVSIK